MYCPYCRYPDSRVVDSRTTDDGVAIRRRRQCPDCGRRFSTTETASLNVVKRSGVVAPFSRDKIINGVRKACQGRPVTDADLAVLAQRVEETVRSTGAAQVEANDIGLAILQPLRELDEVAYLRFASVYQAFDSLDDFEAAITLLRVEHSDAVTGGPASGSPEVVASAAGNPAAANANGPSGANTAVNANTASGANAPAAASTTRTKPRASDAS